jgi:hypothetical protein
MTETAGTVAKDILLELVVLGAEATLEADEIESTIRYMNRYMTMIEADGISLGYTKVSSLSDPITVADGAIMGMIKNVALMLAPQYGAIVSQELILGARNGMSAMENLAVEVAASSLPCTLPIGSGNEWSGFNAQRFYPCADDAVLTEQNQSIFLEDDTNGA